MSSTPDSFRRARRLSVLSLSLAVVVAPLAPRSPASAKTAPRVSLALLLAALAARAGRALQFDVEPGATRCLGEIIGKHDVAKGSLALVPLPGAAPGAPLPTGVSARVTSPADAEEFAAPALTATPVKFSFTGTDAGQHAVCATNAGAARARVELVFASGAESKDYEGIAKSEHLKPIELELRKLEDRVEAIAASLGYAREAEEEHRNTSERTNARVQTFSAATIAIVVATAVVQIYSMWSFFRKTKRL